MLGVREETGKNGSGLLEKSSRGTEECGFYRLVREESWLEPRGQGNHINNCVCWGRGKGGIL
jgi:hypothetical protein